MSSAMSRTTTVSPCRKEPQAKSELRNASRHRDHHKSAPRTATHHLLSTHLQQLQLHLHHLQVAQICSRAATPRATVSRHRHCLDLQPPWQPSRTRSGLHLHLMHDHAVNEMQQQTPSSSLQRSTIQPHHTGPSPPPPFSTTARI